MSRASTAYKKKDGSLAVADDRKFLFWAPSAPPGASPTVTIPVADIVNLQQTPAGNPKVALKVVVQPAGAAAPENHVFSFTSKDAARAEQEAITETLRNAIATLKSTQNTQARPTPAATPGATPGPTGDGAGQSAAMAIAQAVSSGASKATDGWYDDARLKADFELQKSLLDSNPALRQRFNEARRDKPESISITQFTTQFWSSRLHLLRAHAIEKAQAQGDYNVLPEIKFKRVPAERDGEPDKLMLNLAKEQVKLIFKQYPIVREAYNENVPQMDQNAFWSRFFMSRLLKKLKGQKITDDDPPDPIFDRYLNYKERGPANIGYIPHFIDLEGNEQNHSQRQGNRPDETMRPGSFEKVPILRILNNLSEKMLSQVAPADGQAHAPIGMDEESYNELVLRDLAAEASDNRVVLNIKDQQRFLAGEQDNQLSAEAVQYAKEDPKEVLSLLQADIGPVALASDAAGGLRLEQAIGVQSDSDDSDDEMNGQTNGSAPKKKALRTGSKAAITGAVEDITSSIRTRRLATSGDPASFRGLSQPTYDTLTMTNNTTIEFLHYFWSLFLSGDSSRTNELARLVETLDKSVDRINAVAATAEEERQRSVDMLKQQMQAANPKSNKRRRLELDLESIGGGKKVVEEMINPTIKALLMATQQYRKAYEEQSAMAQ
ncbi:RNA polymerase II transcription factor B subunit 1 [Zalaria obscura]|uniref:RNA polymerase II transcription factor B subunit 1 n=1 Tax=Zalaria obscura TaxID=2024903 RepID=A0ACC3SKN1_9PEZI